MLSLYLFGRNVEIYFAQIFGDSGKLIYLLMYITALAVSVLPTYFRHKNNHNYRSLGASGAVSAVVFAGILFDPLIGIGLFFIPIFIAGFLFGFIYLLVSYYLDKKGEGHINHSAHIYGALYGIAFTIVAAQLFSEYPVLAAFINQIQNANAKDFIQFGRN
jgi:membrane associated rhomboid family serine protease